MIAGQLWYDLNVSSLFFVYRSQCHYGESTVGLFPGQLLSRTPEKVALTSGVGRAYNIGFNSSLANQPPPRR